MKKIIETARLILRPFTIDDVDAFYEVNKNPNVTRYTGDGTITSKAMVEASLRNNTLSDYKKYGYGRFAVIHKADNKLIGFSGLKYLEDLKETDIGYRFLEEYWGKGFATESSRVCMDYGFNELNLGRIIGLVFPENVASVHVLKKLGLQFEKQVQLEEGTLDYYAVNK